MEVCKLISCIQRKFISLLIFSGLFFQLVFSDAPNWDCDGDGIIANYFNFANNASITATVVNGDGYDITSPGDILGVFVNGELQGTSEIVTIPFGPNAGAYAIQSLVYFNASQIEASFKFYDAETDTVYDIIDTRFIEEDQVLGNLFELEVNNNSPLDV